MSEPDDIAVRIRAAAASVQAPPSLRAALAVGPQRAARRRPAPRLIALGGAALALVAVVLALAPGGHDPAATVASAASAALRPPTQPAPRGADGALSVSAAGVRFPDYGAGAHWRPVGTRTDRLGGRTTVSVAYRGAAGAQAGYAIVDGAPLPVPAGARRIVYEGVSIAVIERDGLRIVTWRRGGRTCVVAARATSLDRLLDLAAQT